MFTAMAATCLDLEMHGVRVRLFHGATARMPSKRRRYTPSYVI